MSPFLVRPLLAVISLPHLNIEYRIDTIVNDNSYTVVASATANVVIQVMAVALQLAHIRLIRVWTPL